MHRIASIKYICAAAACAGLAGVGAATHAAPPGAADAFAAKAPDAGDAMRYDALIQQARDGNRAPALQFLRRQAHGAQSAGRLHDHIRIAAWDGQDAEATRLYEDHAGRAAMPVDVLGTVAKSYRNQRRWYEALAVYDLALARTPQDRMLRQGRILVLVDAGRDAEARQAAEDFLARHPSDARGWLALGYLHAQTGRDYDAWQAYDKAHALAPQQAEALVGHVHAMRRIGLAEPALSLASRHPDVFTPAQLRDLQADRAAELVRLAAVPPRSEKDRFVLADRALAYYDALQRQWRTESGVMQQQWERLRIDRMGAQHSRHDYAGIIDAYQSLRQDGVAVPAYALRLVASAYLELRQPEAAAALYQDTLAMTPEDDEDRILSELGLFYAQIESEDFPAAAQTIAQANRRDAHVRVLGQPEPLPNQDRFDAQLAHDMAYLYRNETDVAQQRLEAMMARAPYNQRLHTALASVHRARQQPRQAEARLKLGEALAPRNPELLVEQGLAALDLQEWEQARLLSDDAWARYPERANVKRLKRLYEVYRKPELRVSGHRGLSNDSPVSGDGDYAVDAVLYSPPIDDNWRVFAGGGKAHGTFLEGVANHTWQRAGVEWRGRDWTAEAEVSNNRFGHGSQVGARLQLAHDINDQWQVGGGVARLSRATPLRALRAGIRSDDVSVYARWRGNERREWRLSATASRFDDGNRRAGVALDGRERLHTSPHLAVDATLGVRASRNSRADGAPYFNPRADLEILPGLQLTHILHRRYETVWEHALQLGVGSYTQRHYGTGAIATIGYGHRFRTNDVFEAGVMVSTGTRPYDGVRERETRISFDLNIRF